jgi:septum formation protein
MSLQAPSPRLVLASASATRRELLRAAGLTVEPLPARIDEDAIKTAARAEGATPGDAALMLARAKARKVAAQHPDDIVIGCDQLLVCGGRWFDKPADAVEAREHLCALRGHTHTLHTAVICLHRGEPNWSHVATPRLAMRDFSDAFLEDYLTREAAHLTTSVGAYRLEGAGIHLFESIEGEHSAILGLPLLALLGFLRSAGVVAA